MDKLNERKINDLYKSLNGKCIYIEIKANLPWMIGC